jgi:hypothetical protein
MGGYGSTRWGFHSKRQLIEDSKALSAYDLVRSVGRGLCAISWHRGDQPTGSIGVIVTEDRARLIYTYTPNGGSPRDLDYPIAFQSTPTPWGARRYWLTCPACGRRVGKVYLPPGDQYFACRRCHDLAYRSNQEQHEFDGLYRTIARQLRIAPGLVREIMRH